MIIGNDGGKRNFAPTRDYATEKHATRFMCMRDGVFFLRFLHNVIYII